MNKKLTEILYIDNLQIKNFTKLGKNEKELVLKWRNHKNIRKWMYNDHIISPKEHENFLINLKKDNSKIYWLVKRENKYLGVINLTRINSKHRHAFLGIYANPYEKISNAGNDLMKSLLTLSFSYINLHTLKLEVFSHNNKAITFYEKHGFKKEGILREYIFKDKWYDVIIMGVKEDEI